MNRYIILFTFIFSALNVLNAQKNRTYLGHKYLVEANYSAYVPLFNTESYLEYENDVMVTKNNRGKIQSGLQLSLSRYLSGSTSFGLEFDYGKSVYSPVSMMYPNPNDTYSYSSYYLEKIDVNCMSFIGKFEFTRREGISPIGLSHQVGAGLILATPVKKEGSVYAVSYDEGAEVAVIDYKLTNAKGITAFYNLNFRVNLSKNLLLNTGIRYNFNYIFMKELDYGIRYPNDSDLAASIRSQLSWNVMRIYTGLAYSF